MASDMSISGVGFAKTGKDKKDRKRLSLALNQKEVEELINAVQKHANAEGLYMSFTFNTGAKTSKNGKKYKTGFFLFTDRTPFEGGKPRPKPEPKKPEPTYDDDEDVDF